MSDSILLSGMEFSGCHGVYQWEKENPQRFIVDIRLEMDLGGAGASDKLADTVDYGKVYKKVREIVEGQSFNLIEALGHRIAEALLQEIPEANVTVTVKKPEVDLGGPLGYAAVEITRLGGKQN